MTRQIDGHVSPASVPDTAGAIDIIDRAPGFFDLHPDVSVNFQLNRWLAWMTPAALPDVAEVAARVRGYADFIREFLALAERLAAAKRRLDAALCLRAAEFFLPPGDERRAPARGRFLRMIRDEYGLSAEHQALVPYPGGGLPAYRFGAADKGTLVLFGGFDSYIEEFLPMMLAAANAGYQVIGFEGPGQGGALEDHGLVLSRDWHRPVGAVLDHFALDRVTLVGISLGGCLAIRAAAHEPRVARVIADDVLTDFLETNLRQLPGVARATLRTLRAAHAKRLIDAIAGRRTRRDLLASWGLSQGRHVLGVTTAHEYFDAIARYTTADVSPLVTADVLLLAGADDHYVPFRQLADQITTLTQARSVTARVFTRAEQAHSHCQVGNIGLSLHVMLEWLAGLDRRDSPHGTAAPSPSRSV